MYDSGVVRKVCAFLALPETDKKPGISATVSGAILTSPGMDCCEEGVCISSSTRDR